MLARVRQSIRGAAASLVAIAVLLATSPGVGAVAAAKSPATSIPVVGILHLDLGPLSLDILGLQVNLSRIVLDITAQAGAGDLLGNLLCAVVGVLDNPNTPANLLNDILAAFSVDGRRAVVELLRIARIYFVSAGALAVSAAS